jgi:hypothetical protein
MKKNDSFQYLRDTPLKLKPDSDTFVAIMPAGISTVEELFNALFEVLLLPGYFGFNWNAVLDCLRDFHWLTEKKIILIHKELPSIPKSDLWEYLDVLYDCIEGWEDDEEHNLSIMFPESCRAQIEEIMK